MDDLSVFGSSFDRCLLIPINWALNIEDKDTSFGKGQRLLQ
jgi:hypothetical protein